MRRQKFATPVGVERSDKILTILGALILLGGAYVAWNLGANDGANSMGTAVGAGVRTMREAVLIVGVFGLLGAVTMGSGVIKTIGRGIVPLDTIDPHIATLIALAAMFAAGLWLTLATYLRLPVSTTHSTVGAVAGAGVAVGDVPVIWARFGDIFIAWIATPIGAAVLAFLLYTLMNKLLSRFSVSNRVWAWLLTLSGIYMAFSWGANDVANATGVIVGAGLLEANWAAVLGGIGIAVGVATWGYKVMQTVGSGITALAPPMAFIAEFAAALNVQIYTLFGIPVSTTHAIVGAIIGVGLVHGRTALNAKTARDIMLAWAGTPIGAGILAFVLYHVFQLVFGGGG